MKLLESSDPQTNDGLASGIEDGSGGSDDLGPGGHYLENTWKKPQKGNDGLPRKQCPTTIDWAAIDWAVSLLPKVTR